MADERPCWTAIVIDRGYDVSLLAGVKERERKREGEREREKPRALPSGSVHFIEISIPSREENRGNFFAITTRASRPSYSYVSYVPPKLFGPTFVT